MTLAGASIAAFALADISVLYNGRSIPFTDAQPKMENGRVLVPLRAVLEGMGVDVQFDAARNIIMAQDSTTTVQLRLGAREASVNGRLVYLDVPAQAVNGRTFIPLRFFGEAFGAEVKWRAYDETVLITKDELTGGTPNPNPGTTPVPSAMSLDHSGMDWLSDGETVTFELRAAPGQSATLYLNEGKIQVPFTEVREGVYTARYTIPNQRTQGVSFSDSDAFAVIGTGANRQAIRAARPLKIDNTRPDVSNLAPNNNQKIAERRPMITAELMDHNGSGIDKQSVKVWLNNKDITSQAYVTDRLLVLRPESDLNIGEHNVRIQVADLAGNVSTVETNFEIVAAANLVQNITINGPTAPEPGDRITISGTVDPNINRAWIKFGANADLRAMTINGTTATLNYTVAKNDAFDDTPIIFVVEDSRGQRIEFTADKTLTMAGASTPKPSITSPKTDDTIGNTVVIQGTATAADRVRVKVEYVGSLLGLLRTTGTVHEAEYKVNEDGTFNTDNISLRGLLNNNADEYIVTVTAINAKGRESEPVSVTYQAK